MSSVTDTLTRLAARGLGQRDGVAQRIAGRGFAAVQIDDTSWSTSTGSGSTVAVASVAVLLAVIEVVARACSP